MRLLIGWNTFSSNVVKTMLSKFLFSQNSWFFISAVNLISSCLDLALFSLRMWLSLQNLQSFTSFCIHKSQKL
ncbi:hypothetical protein Hanom_Chr08g00698711 [Helianthus anomalus]